MESEHSGKSFIYILMLASFFAVLFILEIFGVHYEPVQHSRGTSPTAAKSPLEKPVSETKQVSIQENDSSGLDSESGISAPSSDESNELFFENLKKDYQKRILDKLPANKVRSDIVIRYYQHTPDGNSAFALERLKFYIHKRPINPAFEGYQSNAIFYGDNVKKEDIQMVAYTLISEGLPLKVIKPSQFHDDWKVNAIEIGTDTTLISRPTLTLSDIVEFKMIE